jgi:ribosome maturation factor RimP
MGRAGPHGAVPLTRPDPVECAARRRQRCAGAGGWYRVSVRRQRPVPPRNVQTESPPVGLFVFWVGLLAHFCLRRPLTGAAGKTGEMTGTLRERLIALIEPVVEGMGFELVELEFVPGRAHALLRLYIDRAAGVTLDDCASVSRAVSALLDVEDPIPSAYTLEVSSPGFDRVLRSKAHFGRFVGARVFIELKEPRAGRRRYTGTLLTVDDEGIALEVDREQVAMKFVEISKARLAS